jgi:hypothetical protein
MSRRYGQLSSCSPSAHANTYIYSIARTSGTGLVASTSADEIVLIDATRSDSVSAVHVFSGPKGLTSCSVGNNGQSIFCGDGAGNVSCFDIRTQEKTATIQIGQHHAPTT